MDNRPKHGGNLIWAARLAGCPPDSLVDFSASISPLGPPISVLKAIQSEFPNLVRYPEPEYLLLRRQIAEYHGIDPDWILPGNGSAELLTWAGRAFSSLGGGCYCLTPAFGDYYRTLEGYQVKSYPLPLLTPERWCLDFADWPGGLAPSLERCLGPLLSDQVSCRQKGLLLNNPHNPSGLLFHRDGFRRYLDKFGLIVVDEAFMDFLPPNQQESVIDWVAQYPNLVVLRSLTKFYSIPGLRVGYAVSHPDRLRRWQQWRDPWSVNRLSVVAAISALQDTNFQQRTWDWLPTARTHLFEGLQQITRLCPLPGAANFLLVAFDGSVTGLQKTLLKRHQIYIRDCMSFAELGDRYFRVAVRTVPENQRLIDALGDILA